MFIAEKNDLRCRIPESKVKAYEFMGYTCRKIGDAEKPKSSKKPKEAKTEPLAE